MERFDIRCLFGFHKKRVMPWLQQANRMPGPKKACTRCGKCWYDYILFIGSPERGLFDSSNQKYEGQPPPKGHESWEAYYTARRRGIEKLISERSALRKRL